MFASMIFKKEPFFHGHDNYDQVCVYPTCHFGALLLIVGMTSVLQRFLLWQFQKGFAFGNWPTLK